VEPAGCMACSKWGMHERDNAHLTAQPRLVTQLSKQGQYRNVRFACTTATQTHKSKHHTAWQARASVLLCRAASNTRPQTDHKPTHQHTHPQIHAHSLFSCGSVDTKHTATQSMLLPSWLAGRMQQSCDCPQHTNGLACREKGVRLQHPTDRQHSVRAWAVFGPRQLLTACL
jgi:hypothetical protein